MWTGASCAQMVARMSDITVSIQLAPKQAKAFLRYQVNQYEVLMAEADPFSRDEIRDILGGKTDKH